MRVEIKTIDKKFYKQVGEQLRRKRNSRNISLRELSKEIGFSRELIDNWELGKIKMKPYQFDLMCKALKVKNTITVDVKIGE